MYDAIKEYTGHDINVPTKMNYVRICKELHIELDKTMGRGKLIDEIFGDNVEHLLIQPTFITDYPVEMCPLTKKHRTEPGLVERFELIVNGKELANAYSELNDPIDQRERFEEQVELAHRGDDEVHADRRRFPPCPGIRHAPHFGYRYRYRSLGNAGDRPNEHSGSPVLSADAPGSDGLSSRRPFSSAEICSSDRIPLPQQNGSLR